MLSLVPGVAGAQVNSVVVESKTVIVGQSNVTIGVYISNAEPIVALVMPLEFREITPGAYIQTNISRSMRTDGRLWNSPLAVSPIQNRYAIPGGTPCSGPISNTYSSVAASVDLISPDGFFLATHSTGDEAVGDDIDLDPGTETPGVDVPSYQFTFSVSNVPGQFEIDTCCVRPANHLSYAPKSEPSTSIAPSFTKGIVTILPCECPCWADPNCDGVRGDPLDATIVRNVANGSVLEITDPDCPVSRTDANIDGATDAADVGLFESVAFGGLVDTTVFCHPCLGCPAPIDPVDPPDTGDYLGPLDPWDPIPPDLDTTNWVTVRSRRVLPGADDVVIDVWIENITPTIAMVLPLEFRSVSGGAFVSRYEDFGIPSLSRLGQSPLGVAGPGWPPAMQFLSQYGVTGPSLGNLPCSGPVSHTFGNMNLPGPGSPDGFLIVSVSAGSEIDELALSPGSDPRAYGGGSVRFIVDIGPESGVFEIDTCCISQANHLAFINENTQLRLPGFTKGVITVGCFCQCHGDPQCDGRLDILDVVRTINSAFRNIPAPQDQDCTHARTDVNASGVTDVLDVAKLIDVVMNDAPVEANIVDPCAQ